MASSEAWFFKGGTCILIDHAINLHGRLDALRCFAWMFGKGSILNRWVIHISLFAWMVAAIPVALANDRLPVFVSVLPQKYFVQQIGKDHVDVQVMVQPGASPATYEPKPRQMAAWPGPGFISPSGWRLNPSGSIKSWPPTPP